MCACVHAFLCCRCNGSLRFGEKFSKSGRTKLQAVSAKHNPDRKNRNILIAMKSITLLFASQEIPFNIQFTGITILIFVEDS